MTRDTPDLISTDITAGVVYEAYGSVPPSTRKHAEEMMRRLSDTASEPVRTARIKVKHDEDRGTDETSIAQGSMDFSDISIRVEAVGPTPDAALDAVGERLEDKLARLAGRPENSGTAALTSPPGRWRYREDADVRPTFHYRPPESRTVVRRKTFSPLEQISIAEALFHLDALDYRFFMFGDVTDERTSVVYRNFAGPALRRVDGSRPADGSVEGIHVNEAEAPVITAADAISRLNISEMAFIFFRDFDRGRSTVLYRRYDGHYGLLVPSTRIV